MKRRLDVTPQARRDLVVILAWYKENIGARAASKVARTIQTRLRKLQQGRVRGTELVGGSRYSRAVAKKHVVVFLRTDDAVRVVRIVHGAQDLEAIAADLKLSDEGGEA